MTTFSESIQVLSVDPDRSFAENMATVLEEEDERFEITLATSASDALDRLQDAAYNCVVSEYELPDSDGLELLTRVRETHGELPFILFTDRGSEEIASDAISAGVTDYVQKKASVDSQKLLAHRIVNGMTRYRAQRQAEETERRVQTLAETTNDVLWMFPPDWSEVLFVNSAYEEVWGQSVEALVEDPTNFLKGIHPDARPRVQAAMETLSSGESIELEYRVNPKENFERWVWVQGEPVYDEEGTLDRVVGFVRDITKRKEYERQLEQTKKDLERSNQSLREFAYIASHDLQEPLRMVASFVELLQNQYGEQFDEEAEEYMDFAVDGAQRMKQMINSLLQYSRVHTKARTITTTNVEEVLEDVQRDLQFFLEDHDGELSVGELPTIDADPDQLAQVFRNLIKNALVHADDGAPPQVSISASEREEAFEFAVEDNGPGIPESEQDEIFKIFRQGAEASSKNGTGIGLAISQRIVQRHGGKMWVDSEPGNGATFSFTIPKNLAEKQERNPS